MPAILQQLIGACECNIISQVALADGLAYLLEPFMLVALISALLWLCDAGSLPS